MDFWLYKCLDGLSESMGGGQCADASREPGGSSTKAPKD